MMIKVAPLRIMLTNLLSNTRLIALTVRWNKIEFCQFNIVSNIRYISKAQRSCTFLSIVSWNRKCEMKLKWPDPRQVKKLGLPKWCRQSWGSAKLNRSTQSNCKLNKKSTSRPEPFENPTECITWQCCGDKICRLHQCRVIQSVSFNNDIITARIFTLRNKALCSLISALFDSFSPILEICQGTENDDSC